MNRVHIILVSFDQFMNTVFGGNPDETISTRSGRARDEGKLWGKVLAGLLDYFFPLHVEKARLSDAARAQAIVNIEKE